MEAHTLQLGANSQITEKMVVKSTRQHLFSIEGRIKRDRGTLLTSIVFRPPLTNGIAGGITKVFPHSSDVKKFRQQCSPGKLPEVPRAYPPILESTRCIRFFVRPVLVLFPPFFLSFSLFFFFFLSSVDSCSTENVRRLVASFQLQDPANDGNARESTARRRQVR